ncbi:hypothetical protein ABG810_09095 [Streptococcus iniae]
MKTTTLSNAKHVSRLKKHFKLGLISAVFAAKFYGSYWPRVNGFSKEKIMVALFMASCNIDTLMKN